MDPNRYLREIHEPLCDVIAEICEWEEIDCDYVFWKKHDLREVLKRLSERLLSKRKQSNDGQDGQRLSRIRTSIQWLNAVLNTYAHDSKAKPELVALSFAASLEILRVNAGFKSLAAFEILDQLRERLFASIFSEYILPSEGQSGGGDTSNVEEQILAIHDKIDKIMASVIDRADAHAPVPTPANVILVASNKQKLLDIRAEIERVTEESKRPLEGWEHIIQYRRLDDLIAARPRNKQELLSWVQSLNSYRKNEAVMKRQVERWGDEIIRALQ